MPRPPTSAPDKRGASASVPPKTLRPTGCAGLHSSRRPSLVEKKGQAKRNRKQSSSSEQWWSLMNYVVNYGQLVCYKNRPSSRATNIRWGVRVAVRPSGTREGCAPRSGVLGGHRPPPQQERRICAKLVRCII